MSPPPHSTEADDEALARLDRLEAVLAAQMKLSRAERALLPGAVLHRDDAAVFAVTVKLMREGESFEAGAGPQGKWRQRSQRRRLHEAIRQIPTAPGDAWPRAGEAYRLLRNYEAEGWRTGEQSSDAAAACYLVFMRNEGKRPGRLTLWRAFVD